MTVINTRRVVVTGMGVVTPIGNTVDDFWAAAKAGTCATGPITNFDTEDLYIKIAAEIKDFEPQQRITNKLLQLADRYSKFAGVAAAEAVKQSGMPVPFTDPYRSAAIIGSGAGGLNTIETAYRDLFILNKRATHPFTLLRFIGSSAAAHVGIDYGIKGPTFGTVSACATATHAIGIVYQYIRYGLVDVGIGGAAEAALNYGSMKSWQALRVLSDKGCFPFSKERNGTVLGEGAGTLVLEELEHAKARGANILAEICGYGMTSDAKDMVKPDLEGPKVAMQMALDDAKLSPSDIDYLNAHGTGTTDNDVNETRAIRAVFGSAAGNPGGVVDQVDDRPPARRRWRGRGSRLHQGDAGRHPAADHQLQDARPRVRPRLCAERRAGEEGRLHDVEFVRLRRPQRRAGVRPAAGLIGALAGGG